MKKKLFIFTVLSSLIACVSANGQRTVIQASSNYITKDLSNITSFEGLEVLGSSDIEYRQSNNGKSSAQIYGSDNVIDHVNVSVTNGILQVRIKDNTEIRGKSKIKVIATSPRLKSARVKGSGDIDVKGTVNTEDIDFEVRGSGDITMDNIKCNNMSVIVVGSGDIEIERMSGNSVTAEVSGSGDIEIAGNVLDAIYRVKGSGDISASKLEARNVNAEVMGSGDIDCYASDSFRGNAKGSGTIVYRGDPQKVNIEGKSKSNIKRK